MSGMYFSRHHGCCRCTSSQANVHENLRELYKKFSKPKQPINPFIRFLVKYKPLFVAKYPTAGLYGTYVIYFFGITGFLV